MFVNTIFGWLLMLVNFFLIGTLFGFWKGRGIPQKYLEENTVYTVIDVYTNGDYNLLLKMKVGNKKPRYYEPSVINLVDPSLKRIKPQQIPEKFTVKTAKVPLPTFLQNEKSSERNVWMIHPVLD
ncbi:MAG: hypothetical protein KAJ58_01990 [Candidatus Pacebacteria bacterium]|nr:hypothetical protein [Candidatus Paceibacterota bacterium]